MKYYELISRGKSIETNEFVYGYFVGRGNVDSDDSYIVPTIRDNKNIPIYWGINEDTLGLYTQRSDGVRKAIFVGDIIQVKYIGDYDALVNMEVCLGEFEQDGSEGEYTAKKCFGFFLKHISHKPYSWDESFEFPKHCKTISLEEYIDEDMRVIGNIHDNQELLNIK